MWFLSVGLCISAVVLCVDATVASLPEILANISKQCCTQGLNYALNHTSQDCSSSVPPDVPASMGSFCIFAMDSCCKEYFEKKRDCEDGITELSIKNQCTDVKAGPALSCCSECSRGRIDGAITTAACSANVSADSADDSLASVAYTTCCKAEKEKNGKDMDSQASVHDLAVVAKHAIDLSSVCEEYAPNELCAHHCIPVPGSYKCECNPGYMLMSDGRNCREVQKNRCKVRNPCQHKCNDNGVEVKCSCRRGYELQNDGKSCRDIDECALEPSVCLPGTKCYNILGSYKCIPVKKSTLEKGQCPPGFSRNLKNAACDDVNECALPNPPCPIYTCENTVGGYKCGGRPGDPANLAINHVQVPPQEDLCPLGFRAGDTDECEDVDECASHKDDCNHLSQFCINTKGSFYCQDKASKHCKPGFKINSESNICEDIDECLDSNSLCRPDQICVNVPGAYDCKPRSDHTRLRQRCPDGFRMKPGGTVCEDIDECLEGTHLCDFHQNCLNLNGSHECDCKIGYEADIITGACIDINECAKGQNECIPESQRCDNTVGSYLCIRIVSCGTGYILHHTSGVCEDIDECALGTHNCGYAGTNYQCMNIPGSFRCVRRTSPTSSTTTAATEYEYEYYDSDEEVDNNQTTAKKIPEKEHEQSAATTTTTRPEPNPDPTEILPPLTSTPTTNKQHELHQGVDYPPEDKQEPVNETSEDNNVDTQKPDLPIDQLPDPNSSPRRTAEETSSSKPSQDFSHVYLDNTNEDPITVKGIKSQDGSVMVDTQDIPKNKWTKIAEEFDPGSCQNGFERNEYGACLDIDECAIGKHFCSGLTEACRNTLGGYVCDCAPGFRRDLSTNSCDLISTSSTSTSTASPPTVKVPERTPSQWTNWGYPIYQPPKTRPFRPRNICDVGFHWNAKISQCEDIDECTNGLASCAAVEECINTDGGYRCECPPNWSLDEIRHQCVPTRRTNNFPSGYGNSQVSEHNIPNNGRDMIVIGSKHGNPGKNTVVDPDVTDLGDRGTVLRCPQGYSFRDDHSCVDVDECSMGTANCGPTQICTNLLGGYVCSCPKGQRLIENNLCEDVDECILAGNKPICSEHADCINTMGSYQCRCHEGFRSAPANDKVCMDVDECTEARAGALCEHRCNNVWGGYRCSCHRGYRLNHDNKTCSDIDECVEFASKKLCVGKCNNEPGSYRCGCPAGYRLSEDSRSCIDIDECETGEAACSGREPQGGVSEVCVNTRGGYRCNRITCPHGYQLENRHRCTRVVRVCSMTDYECIHQPSTYSFNYITFVSELYIPDKQLDLFTMRGPTWRSAKMRFQLRLVDVNAPPTVREKADIHAFLLNQNNTQAVVSLIKSLEGPQSIELELSMELYNGELFGGVAVAKLFIYVSEYTF